MSLGSDERNWLQVQSWRIETRGHRGGSKLTCRCNPRFICRYSRATWRGLEGHGKLRMLRCAGNPDFGHRSTVQGCYDRALARVLGSLITGRQTLCTRGVAHSRKNNTQAGGQVLRSCNMPRKPTNNHLLHVRGPHLPSWETIAKVEETRAQLFHKLGEIPVALLHGPSKLQSQKGK